MLPSLTIEEVADLASRVLPFWLLLQAKGTVILLLAAIGTAAFVRRGSAANRHLIWTTAFAGVLALPIVAVVSPSWDVGVFGGGTGEQGPGTGGDEGTGDRGTGTGGAIVARDDRQRILSEPERDELVQLEPTAEHGAVPVAPDAAIPHAALDMRKAGEPVTPFVVPNADSPPVSPVVPPADTFRVGPLVPLVILSVWSIGVVGLLIRLGWGLAALGRLRRAAEPIQAGFVRELNDQTAGEMGLRQKVALVSSQQRFVPMTWGVFRPVVLVPAHMIDWPVARLRLILAHELAHVRRRDAAIDLAAQAAWALCWFNPLAWWGLSRLRLEREKACDDAVLAVSERPTEYAETLLTVVQDASRRRPVHSAALLMARPGQVEERVRSVLDETRCRREIKRHRLAIVAVLAGIFVMPLAMFRPVARGNATTVQKETQSVNLAETTDLPAPVVAAAESKATAADSRVDRAAPAPAGRLGGRVLGAEGKPVPNVTVSLFDRSLPGDRMFRKVTYPILAKATTDERGEFVFPEITPRVREPNAPVSEAWEVIATAPGYALAGLKIPEADRKKRIELKLGPEATIQGRVVDEQDRPLADMAVSITLIAPLGVDHQRQYDDPESLNLYYFSDAPKVQTDAEGKFRIEGLPQNRRIMLGFERSPYCREYAYAATTAAPQPDLKGERFRTVVDRKALWDDSKVHTGEFTVAMKPGRQLTGRVVLEPSGTPCPGATVDLSHYNRFHGAITDADGRFSFSGIPDMENRLYVTVRDRPNHVGRSMAVAFRPDEPRREIEVSLPVGIVVTGAVLEEGAEHGISGALIVQSTPDDERAADHCLAQMGFAGPEGKFRVVVGPGRTTLRVIGPVKTYDLPDRGTRLDPQAAARFERTIDVVAGQAPPEVRFLVHREESLRAAPGKPAVKAASPSGAAAATDNAKPKRSEASSSTSDAERNRDAPAVAGPRVTARGTVEDLNGQPIAGATVYLREWSVVRFTENLFDPSTRRDVLATTTTTERGEFVFREVPTKRFTRGESYENPWDVIAIAPGFGLIGEHLSDREGKQGLRLKLPAAASLTGRIVDEEGKPLSDALVAVENIGPLGMESLRGYQQPGVLFLAYSELEPRVRTDREGRFRIDRLPRDRRIELKCELGNYVREYFSAATTDQPQPDIVVPGANLGAGAGNKAETKKVHTGDFTIALRPGWEVAGRITLDGSDRAYAGAKLTLMKQSYRQWTTADSDGRYTIFGVPETGYQIVVQPPEGAEWLGRSQEVLLTPEQRRVVMDISLPKGNLVTGIVVDDETGAGIPDVEVQASTVDARAFMPDYASPPGHTDAEGRFRLAVAAGKRRVSVYGPVSGYDAPSRMVRARALPGPDGARGYERFDRTIDVVDGERGPELRFALTHGLTIDGSVLDPEGKPVANAEVNALDGRQRATGGRTVRTDDEGRFRLRGLPVAAAQKLNVVDVVRKLSGRAEVEALSGGPAPTSRTVAVEIRLQSTVTVIGKVTDGSRPIPGVRVSLFEYTRRPNGSASASRVPGLEGMTDEDGRFQIAQVDPGREYKISIEQDRYERPEPQSFTPKPGQDFEHPEIVMRALGHSVSGIVVDPEGNPVEGVTLSARDRKTHRTIQGSRPFVRNVTGPDGRFTFRELPDVPLTLMGYLPPSNDSPNRSIRFPSEVDVDPGQTDVRMILDPKLQRQRVKKIEARVKEGE